MNLQRITLACRVLALLTLLCALVPSTWHATPAGADESTPPGDTGTPTLLFAGTVDPSFVPSNPVWVDVYRMDWAPGATWPYAELYRSFRVWCVEAGWLKITTDGPVTVTRDAGATPDATPEAIPPGTEPVLDSGDCAVTPSEEPYTLHNPGPESAVVVHGMIVPANVDVPGGYPFGQVREEEPFGSSMYSYELPAGPLSVRLERASVPSGADRQETMDLFPAAPEDTARVVRIARVPDPAVAYAITVDATPAAAAFSSPLSTVVIG